ncbi:MAG: adenylate/guanylate cyclase domain-containing protein, partial [Syntrophales bacterium]
MTTVKPENHAKFHVSFRVAISAILTLLLVGTIALIGLLSYVNLTRDTEDLSAQVLDQTSQRISYWVGALLYKAHDQSQMNRSLLGTIKLNQDSLTRLAHYWQRVMEAQPFFTFLSVDLESDVLLSIERTQDGKFTIREAHVDRKNHTIKIFDFWAADYQKRKFYAYKKIQLTSPLGRPPWYIKAKEAGRPIWTDARTIHLGAEVFPGITYAAPFYDKDGKLLGVTTVDFNITTISEFLAKNKVGKAGFAFIIENPADGEPHVIAFPKPETLTHAVTDSRGRIQYEFVPTKNLSDDRAVRFMEKLFQRHLQGPGASLRTFDFTSEGTAYFGSYRLMTGKELPGWIIALIIPSDEIMGPIKRNNRQTLGIGLASFFVILIVSTWISVRISKPLGEIARETEAIGQFELEARPLGHSMFKEVDQLMVATQKMKSSLRSFQKYVPADIVREIIASGQETELGGRRETLTIFFSDIKGFTSISEILPPESLVEQMAEYLEAMSDEIRKKPPGTVDKFIGDSIMAFWGAPTPNPDHAPSACRAALLCQERLRHLRGRWKQEGKHPFFQRIGIYTGEVIVGNIGSETRMNYTVIGDTVNIASRLEGLNKYYGTEIIIGQSTCELVKEQFIVRPLDLVSVVGSTKGIKIYELLGEKKNTGEQEIQVAELCTNGLELYLRRQWNEAIAPYKKVLELIPGDQPAIIMLERCKLYLENPPPHDWTG